MSDLEKTTEFNSGPVFLGTAEELKLEQPDKDLAELLDKEEIEEIRSESGQLIKKIIAVASPIKKE